MESCQISAATSVIIPPLPGRSTVFLISKVLPPTSTHVRTSFSLDPRTERVTLSLTIAEMQTRLARPADTAPSPTLMGFMIFPGPGPSLVWRSHTCTCPFSHRKATVSFVEENEACRGALAEGRTSLKDDIGGGTF